MNVYFAGSIRGEPPDREWFQTLIRYISRSETVLTEENFDYSSELEGDDLEIWEIDMKNLACADALVGEITSPSLGVGYEIGKAEEWGKPILLLYRKTVGRKPSALLNGNTKLKLVEYEEKEDALNAVTDFLLKVKAELLTL